MLNHRNHFIKTLEFIKTHRISLHRKTKLIGVRDTLIGWFLISINTIFFEPKYDLFQVEVNFLIFFLAGIISLFFLITGGNLFSGRRLLKGLLISNYNGVTDFEEGLSTKKRIKWIYFRGLIATGGYIAYSVSKISFGVIDNSAIFGADAIVYAVLASWLLKEYFTVYHWLGLFLAGTGVSYVLINDIAGFTWLNGITAGIAGMLSSIALTIIFFITGIIVRHDPPKRVALHQCICGFLLSLIIFLATITTWHLIGKEIDLSWMDYKFLKNSVISGSLFAIALIFFLRAFLFTRPIIIAVLGYSLNLFVIGVEGFWLGEPIAKSDVISSFLIIIGCLFPVLYEYKKGQKTEKKLQKHKPVYEKDLKSELIEIRKEFKNGKIDKYQYLSEHHEFNKVFLEYQSILRDTLFEEIIFSRHGVIFKTENPRIYIETDGSARSAPLEILNFGEYEPEEERLFFSMIKNGDVIFDIGAHIGWYSLNIAKRFRDSKVYAFEPVGLTCQFLKKNIQINKLINVFPFELGFLDSEKKESVYYFKGGSAIASLKNLINHPKTSSIECDFTTLDNFILINNVPIDILKCDVEGTELFVLAGGKKAIRSHKPIILMEIYEEWCKKFDYKGVDIYRELNHIGYEMFQSYEDRLIKCDNYSFENAIKYNYFFLHKEKHANVIASYS